MLLPRHGAALLVLCGLLSACSPATGLGSGSAAGSSVTERQHQDAQVYAAVMRDDLSPVASLGMACQSLANRDFCVKGVITTQGRVQLALDDIDRLHIPPFMVTDNKDLVTALGRVQRACGPVLTTRDRIAQAYADNEFDTAVRVMTTALSKAEQDAT